MQDRTFGKMLLLALFLMAYWFFGNLYEEIAMIPNQLVRSYETMAAYRAYFHLSSPTLYFVPLTQIAVVVVLYLYIRARATELKRLLRMASLFALLAILLTVLIVTQINVKLFSGNLDELAGDLYALSLMWLIGNAVRICLVGCSLSYLLKAYVLWNVLSAEHRDR